MRLVGKHAALTKDIVHTYTEKGMNYIFFVPLRNAAIVSNCPELNDDKRIFIIRNNGIIVTKRLRRMNCVQSS